MTRVINKHLLPVYDRPMIYYPLRSLRSAGVRDACVVVGGREPAEFQEILEDGREFGFSRLRFVEQEGEGGIAAALASARSAIDGHPICVILGDNILEDSLAPFAKRFLQSHRNAMVLLTRVPDPVRFGVPRVDVRGRIVEIVEKPVEPASDFAVVGVYFYPPRVWKIIDGLTPSARGELEITDVNNAYARRGQLEHAVLEGFWGDAGTTESLFLTAAMVRDRALNRHQVYAELAGGGD